MTNLNQILYQVNNNFQQFINNIDEALRLNLDLLIKNLHFDRAAVFLLDEKESSLRPAKIVTIHGEIEGEGENLINNLNNKLSFDNPKEIIQRKDPEAGIYVPLTLKKKKLGFLRVDNFFSHQEIKSEQIMQLKSVAELFSLGIYNITEYHHFKHQVDKLTTLTKIGNAMATSLKVNEILELTLSSLVKDLGYDRAQIYLWDDTTNKIRENLSIDFRGFFRSIDTSTSENISPLQALLSQNAPSFLSRKFSSHLIAYIPITWKDKRTGLLEVDNLFTRQTLTSYDLSFLGILADQLATVIENSRLFERVERLSITDSLTGLFNHRYFYERLSEEVARAHRFGNTLALLMLDIDHFKNFNDTYGHQAGDMVLRSVSQIIQENIRSIDIASRYGGEEIAIILPETYVEGARTIAERIRVNINKHKFKIGHDTTHITVSIGLVCYPSDSAVKSELVKKADLALYCAKHRGRNQVCVYTPSIEKDI